ncbi:hypothetical protein [Pseudoalteromonas sp. T1lg88]|uniref:hypothetical protein n=1 Tax=Pseudoalteromonas sp. T1lg88 TaxID=2077104 RepID=UPI000CF641FD|nr:hypothetical protein [Pseudoalteromonas sp. T1lg88]
MLWTVTKPDNSGLYWLDDVYKNFYQQLFEGAGFDECFLDGFNIVLVKSTKTKTKFQDVFDGFNDLEDPLKNRVQEIYASHIAYKHCFSSIDKEIKKPCEELSEFWEKVKSLATYLYSTTLGLVCFKDACAEEADMDVHYQEYKELNGVVCCFCGTEEMMEEREIEPEDKFEAGAKDEKQWRASYDHYLPKKLYPFLSVDFNNLIPCCQKCNEKAKGEIDVLLADDVRTLAFYPYDDDSTVQLEASLNQVSETLAMTIDIKDSDGEANAKADTWNRAFKVIPRVNRRLKNFHRSWLAPLLNGVEGIPNVRTTLGNEIQRCVDVARNEREAFIKHLCFTEVESKSDEEIEVLIKTVKEIYSRRQIRNTL